MKELPKKFEERMQERLGEEYNAFTDAIQQDPVISIRLHPEKGKGLFVKEEATPWCKYGRYLQERPAFVWDPLYHAGAYYAQDASSMIFANLIDFSKRLRVLDLCAAPGGKSTLMLSFMSKDSLLVTNEMVGKRASILEENIVKWGAPNCLVTSNRPTDFLAFRGFFDVVLVDAPCSGEGMFRKDAEAARLWSENLVNQCSYTQKEIMDVAIQLVSENGLLVYSTCTFEPDENENILKWAYEKYADRLSPAKLPQDESWGLQRTSFNTPAGEQEGFYCLPHKVKGEGMFISGMHIMGNGKLSLKSGKILRKLNAKELELIKPFADTDNTYVAYYMLENTIYAMPEAVAADAEYCLEQLRVRKSGTIVGTLQRDLFIPDHDLVTSGLASREVPRIELDIKQSIDYMQRKLFNITTDAPKGWVIFSYNGIDIGWAKNIGNRINIHYPKEWRIRKTPIWD